MFVVSSFLLQFLARRGYYARKNWEHRGKAGALLPHSKFQARPGLVFRASPRFVDRDHLIGTEKRRKSYFLALGKIRRDGFQVLLVEAHRTHFHGGIRIDQKNRRYIRKSVRLGDYIAILVVDHDRKRYAILLRKARCVPGVILRDS